MMTKHLQRLASAPKYFSRYRIWWHLSMAQSCKVMSVAVANQNSCSYCGASENVIGIRYSLNQLRMGATPRLCTSMKEWHCLRTCKRGVSFTKALLESESRALFTAVRPLYFELMVALTKERTATTATTATLSAMVIIFGFSGGRRGREGRLFLHRRWLWSEVLLWLPGSVMKLHKWWCGYHFECMHPS